MPRSPFLRYSTYLAGAILLVTLLFPGFIAKLWSSGPFMPHATCYLRDPGIIWLHVTTDLAIGMAYVAIAATLGYLVAKASRDLPFHWAPLAFGTFIVSCGITHFMEVLTVWVPLYWLSGYIKVITAVASVATAISLFPLVPKVFRAVSQVKAADERRLALEKAHRQLERANQELAAQKAELELANRDLEMFAHSVAHDLKAPARTVAGFCAILQEDHAADLGQEAQELVGRMSQASQRMELLLRDLLHYASISRTVVQLERLRLEPVVREALTLVESERAAAHASITVEVADLQVCASASLLVQVLVNLIGNALKYVPAGVAPEVKITAERRGDAVRLYVQDNGIGIAPQDQEKIFEIFVRLHTPHSYEGTGIGLALVRRAAERMGGKAGVESQLGQGSRFWVEVQVAPT